MSDLKQNRGRVTIPTDVDVVPETLELLERWGRTPSGTVTAPTILSSSKA